jgi:hypothetical protein
VNGILWASVSIRSRSCQNYMNCNGQQRTLLLVSLHARMFYCSVERKPKDYVWKEVLSFHFSLRLVALVRSRGEQSSALGL